MKHFDYIYEIAADNYGLVTAADAKRAGITGVELNRWTRDGRLDRLGQGVYKLVHHAPTDFDRYAEACVLVGPGAYLYGESVLAMHGLALVNPSCLSVAVKKRVRKTLPGWIRIVKGDASVPGYIEGIPSQSVADAIRSCRGSVMDDRLKQAVEEAREAGLVSRFEYESLKGEF